MCGMVDDEGSGQPEAPAFEDFFVRVEPRLRVALTSLYGADMGREATAEAMAWAFEYWDRVKGMEHPVSYLYRVGQSRTRRLRRRRPPQLGVAAPESSPEIDPRLVGALAELP